MRGGVQSALMGVKPSTAGKLNRLAQSPLSGMKPTVTMLSDINMPLKPEPFIDFSKAAS